MADFETTTDPNDCRVWIWGLMRVGEPDTFEYAIDIESFIDRISEHNMTCYFHNLKFDGHFIIDWLLKNGFEHSTEKTPSKNEFTSLISNMGMFYSITVRWANGHSVEFRDSYKKIHMSVRNVAKAFELEEGKGEIDYHTHRPVGHIPTPEEVDYLRRDVNIMSEAMRQVLDSGMTKLTVASDSLSEYKRLIGDKYFSKLFPVFPDHMDAEVRRAYRGGFTYADPRYRGRILGCGHVLDVNSLYPSVMVNRDLPYAMPEFFEGYVQPTLSRPLTIFSVTFTAKIKPNHIPCIQIKGSSVFAPTEYLSVISEPTTMMVTNIDWDLYLDHYDIEIYAYGGGWRFHSAKGMFDTYIDKWAAIKAASHGGQREIAKLHLNSLYGKFATNPNVSSKIPVLEEGRVRYMRGADERRPPVYTAVGVFITSFARDLTIRAAQENYSTFAYADTDSLHLLQDDVPESIEIHPHKMGAWKLEYRFDAAYYIRPKAYLERTPETRCKHDTGDREHGEHCMYVNRLAGLPEIVSRTLTFDDLVDGRVLHGKLNPRSVPGGVILKDVPFELKL
jgi:hypothetical protein